MALHKAEFDKAVDMSAECPFIDTSDAAANLVVGGEHGITVTWPEETQHSLKCLDVAGA